VKIPNDPNVGERRKTNRDRKVNPPKITSTLATGRPKKHNNTAFEPKKSEEDTLAQKWAKIGGQNKRYSEERHIVGGGRNQIQTEMVKKGGR